MTIKDDFERDGVVVCRSVISSAMAADWLHAYECEAIGRIPEHNPVAVNDLRLTQLLASIARRPEILDLVEQLFGPDIALYHARFVVKDKHSRGPVFLHQDTGYHFGWPRKLSAFVALSDASLHNGGMLFLKGTHRYGYLADAGELRETDQMDWNGYALNSGDVVLMHSACWHKSVPHKSGTDRILADIIYQPADDPSGIELLRGEWKTDVFLTKQMRENLFVRSRVSRIKELEAKCDQLQLFINQSGHGEW